MFTSSSPPALPPASRRPAYRIAKRVLDLTVAGVGLLAFWWLFALVALLVKATSRGPVLFRQARAGLGGKPFTILKFRTMRADARLERGQASGGPPVKMRDDPRITALGRVLRRTSLDESPQLVNVLLGQMSLVGPRPLPLDEAAALRPEHQRRHDVLPGLTGLWQASGRNRLPPERMMALDLDYVARCSLWLDLRILLATIPAVLTGRGAF